MSRLRLVVDADVPLHLLADRLREVGHWVPPDALEAAIDAAILAGPPALQTAVRTRIRELGCEDGPEERAMFARLLELFAARGPGALARLEAAVDGGDAVGAASAGRRLARQAEALDAASLAALCARAAARAGAGDVGWTCEERAALRREMTVDLPRRRRARCRAEPRCPRWRRPGAGGTLRHEHQRQLGRRPPPLGRRRGPGDRRLRPDRGLRRSRLRRPGRLRRSGCRRCRRAQGGAWRASRGDRLTR